MDLIKQQKLYGWVIGILVVMNLLALSVVWVQSDRAKPVPPRASRNPSAISVELMQRELGLSADQKKKYEQLRSEQVGDMKRINDELDSLKLQLIDDIFESPVNGREVDSTVARIAAQQSKLEVLRFKHFSALALICDREQKAKLHPILLEVFGKKGPDVKSSAGPEQGSVPRPGGDAERRPHGQPAPFDAIPERDKAATPEMDGGENEGRRQQSRREGQAPPSVEEKLDRFVQRLSLTAEQTELVGNIVKSTRDKEEAFKSKFTPAGDEFEREKQKIRDQEDRSIMQILDEKQKAEFTIMIKNRGNPGRN